MIKISKRKICVVTGTRAEYGLLYWLMKEIEKDKELELQIIATGMHLSPEFGLTYKVIEEDGFTINEKIEMLLSSDTPVGIAKSMGLGTIGFTDALDRLKPDVLVVLGDRYEILVAAQVAMVLNIPIAHIHGGELTYGAYDDSIRHAVTKMSTLHFVSTEEHRKRVIRLGEQIESVFDVGALGIESINKMEYYSEKEIEDKLSLELNNPLFLITQHPTTLANNPIEGTRELLEALDDFPNATLVFTRSNADNNGREINTMIQKFVDENPNKRRLYASLGQKLYLSVLKEATVVIGNSSSGLLEAAYLNTPTVNIGRRQDGRARPKSVFDCDTDVNGIIQAINDALDFEFDENVNYKIFGDGSSAIKIKTVLKRTSIDSTIKRFYDGEVK